MNNKSLKFVPLIAAVALFGCSEDVQQAAKLKQAEIIGNLADRNMKTDVAGGFHTIPIARRELAPNIYQVTGVANTHLVKTSKGSVIFDAGLVTQAARQIKLLKEIDPGHVTHVILSHSHQDHVGGTQFWEGEGTEVVAHREYAEEQRYLKHLEAYFWKRNRTLFPWIPEEAPQMEMVAYGHVKPTLFVDENDYKFEQGGVQFEVLSTPGAEGADNISLWLPQEKMLFTGDFFGPLFPQFPNIFTMRGEKVRKPIEYIRSLDKLLALNAEVVVPSHHDPIRGADQINAALTKMRDAVQYVHDETVAGMNAGKSVWQLMDEVQLPAHLELTQEHGKTSWAVRSIWEYYATWFHFDSTTELYSVSPRSMYGELAELAGVDRVLAKAQAYFEQEDYVRALHMLEYALGAEQDNQPALELRLATLEAMLAKAITSGNSYEKDWLRSRVKITRQELGLEE